jgi:ornithine cyclodeaminase
MGADAIGKRELSSDILKQVSLLVADSKQQCEKVGELQWATGETYSFRVEELGAILSGTSPGRRHSEDIVVFDSTGVGFQDVIGAYEVVRKLKKEVNDESDQLG